MEEEMRKGNRSGVWWCSERGSKENIDIAVQSIIDPKEPVTTSKLEKLRASEASEIPVVVGADLVQYLLQGDTNSGLAWFYNIPRKDSNTIAPFDRVSMLRWAVAESPILIQALDLLVRWVSRENKRVLIFVDTPWTARFTHENKCCRCDTCQTFCSADGAKMEIRKRHCGTGSGRPYRPYSLPQHDHLYIVLSICKICGKTVRHCLLRDRSQWQAHSLHRSIL